MNTAGVINTTE